MFIQKDTNSTVIRPIQMLQKARGRVAEILHGSGYVETRSL